MLKRYNENQVEVLWMMKTYTFLVKQAVLETKGKHDAGSKGEV